MNIIENGVIDWSMFGLAVKNYRRNNNLSTEQFAEFMNRVNGSEKPIITQAMVERIEAGKAKPSLDQLNVFDRLVVGDSQHIANAIGVIADELMFSNQAASLVTAPVEVANSMSPVEVEICENIANASVDFSAAPEL